MIPSFQNERLLLQAFTHRSYLNENPSTGSGQVQEHNERLEFLGDAVLELIVTKYLFDRFPQKPEGELTSFRAAMVNTQTLSMLANELGINDQLRLSKGEAKDTGRARQYILANTLEAIVGALYLDQGYGAAEEFVSWILFPKADALLAERIERDAKSYFQERAQERAGLTPRYGVLSEVGPDHKKEFIVGVWVGDEQVASGGGFSKQEAEQEAARAALKKPKWS